MSSPKPKDTELKSMVSDIANNFLKLFNVDKLRGIVQRFVRMKYDKGVKNIEKQLDFNVQFGDQVRDFDMLNNYVFDNIKGMTDDIQNKLRGELQRGLMGNESAKQLRSRISDIFRGSEPTRFNFENRVKMIARTEGKRASNMAMYSQASKLNRVLYKYTTLNPKDPCPICKKISSETKENPIPMESMFVHGKTSEKFPPFHCNCLCNLIITQKKEMKE